MNCEPILAPLRLVCVQDTERHLTQQGGAPVNTIEVMMSVVGLHLCQQTGSGHSSRQRWNRPHGPPRT
jgi:hypothetical protein